MKNKLMKMTTMIILALAMILSTISVAAVESGQPGTVESPDGGRVEKEDWIIDQSGTINISGIVVNDVVEAYKVIEIEYNERTNQVERSWVPGVGTLVENKKEELGFSTVDEYAENAENARKLYELVIKALSNGSLEMESVNTVKAESDTVEIKITKMGQYMVIGKGANVYAPMTATFEPTLEEIEGENEYVYYRKIKIGAKASRPTVDKKIVPINKGQEINSENTDSVAIEDWVNYNLNVTAPFFPEKAVDKTFVLRDTMEKGLKGVSGITITADDGTVLDGVPLTGTQFAEIRPDLTGYDYGVKYYEDTQFNGEAESSEEAGSFEIIFNMDSEKVNGKAKLVVDYDSLVTDLMEPSKKEGDGEDNTVTLIWPKNVWEAASDYRPEENDKYNREDDTVTVFTYGLVVKKTDEKTEKPLEGAVFKLYKVNEDGVEVQIGKELSTNSNGIFVVTGLDEGNYRLKEIKAPDGYVLLNEEIEFAIIGARYENGELTGYLKNEQGTILETAVVEVGVTNRQGFNLPKTGGAGTAIFTILGVVLMGGALLLVVRMRKANGAK